MKATTILLVFLSLGCAQRRLDYSVAISPGFVPAHAEAIVSALDAWRSAVPELRVSVRVGECRPENVCFLESVSFRGTGDGGEYYGYYTQSTNVVEMYTNDIIQSLPTDASSSSPKIRRTAMHEFGHALGLQHEDGTVMGANVDIDPDEITSGDVRQFWAQ